MRPEESEHFGWAKAERLVEPAARTQMEERDPGVLRVPDDGRHQANGESAEQEIEAWPLELAAMPRDEREHQQHRDELERVRIFAQKSQANEKTGRGPEPKRPRSSFEGDPEGEHRRRPKKDRERIDRH